MEMKLVLVVGALCSFAYLVYSVYYLESGAWKRQRRRLVKHGVERGLTPLSAQASTLTGTLDGLPFRIGLAKYRGSKTEGYKLRAELSVPHYSGVTVNQESVLSGAQRLTGEREATLGDREVDACFWLEGPEDTLRRLFTSPAREALLRALPEIPDGSLREGKISGELVMLTPFFVERNFLAMMVNFQLLAAALQGHGSVDPLPEGFVVGRKLRKFARTSLWFIVPLGLLAIALPGSIGLAAQAIMAIGLALTLLALTGRQTSRVLLQAYYAFLTIALAALVLVGGSVSLFNGQAELKNLAAAAVLCLVLMGLCWSARHYMRALDLTGVTSHQENPRKPQF